MTIKILKNTTTRKLFRHAKRVRRLANLAGFIIVVGIPLSLIVCLSLSGWGRIYNVGMPETIKTILTGFSSFILATNVLYFIWMSYLSARRYHEVAPLSDEELPTCAVIVPAYNEGALVKQSLKSVLASDYPPEKLTIISVNDGSKDDTWRHIQEAEQEAKGRIKALNFTQNRGKRYAIYEGVKATDAEIVVTIDSDSLVASDTIRRLVSPFVYNRRVGGVAGNVRVLNFKDGMIPKMLEVNFLFSFEFIRSAQSAIRGVFCSPGALSAMRKDVILPSLGEWVEEKFMGRPSNIGEDRALNNIILKAGYDVLYQRSAVVLTQVPTGYRELCKMLIRWARSNVRENLAMFPFVFNRFDWRDERLLGLQLNLLMQTLWMFLPVLTSFIYIYCVVATLGTFVISVLPVVIIWAAFPAMIYFLREGGVNAILAYIFAVFYFITLFWIAPYAVFSIHRSGWLTRTDPVK